MRVSLSITALAASRLAWAVDICADPDLTIRTTSGAFTGFVDPNVPNVNQWLGIPFAAPPVGAKRFMPPEPVNYTGAHDATSYKPICFQQSTIGQGVFWELVPEFQNTDPQSEDCLYLNIWGPRKPVDSALAPAAKVPVIIWGGFSCCDYVDYDLCRLLTMRQCAVVDSVRAVAMLRTKYPTSGFSGPRHIL
jgi:carboxylesterase type B